MNARESTTAERNSLDLVDEIKKILLEISELEPALEKAGTRRSFPSGICDIPKYHTLCDETISKLKDLATFRLFVLSLIKFARDMAYVAIPTSFSFGILTYALGETQFVKELLCFAILLVLVLAFLDKHMINDRANNSRFFPMPDHLLPVKSYDALYERYHSLSLCCEEWLTLDSKVKNDHFLILNQDYTGEVKVELRDRWTANMLSDEDMTHRLEDEVRVRLKVSVK